MSRKFVLIALGTMMSAPVWAQGTAVGTVAKGRISPLDTMRAMLQRRNPTIDEVLSWSADIKKRIDEFQVANERARRDRPAGDERRATEIALEIRQLVEDLSERQAILAKACELIRPHLGESEGVLGFQIQTGTEFQRTSPVIKEERFVRTPEIMFVEPNSPAAKADVREGDVWLAIEGKELVNTYVRELNEVLKPGVRVDLKIRREGRDVNIGVIAKKRPEFPSAACNMFEMRPVGTDGPQIKIFNGPLPTGKDFFTMKITRAAFAGAAFVDLTDAKRERLKVPAGEKGVLVESVDLGSAADLAGLHELDVVLRANNEVIESAIDLIKIIRSGRQVGLWIWDGAVQRGVTLPAR